MYYNVNENDENTNRLIRPDNLKIDLANSTLSDLMQREKDVMEENIAARRRESHFKDKDDNERRKRRYSLAIELDTIQLKMNLKSQDMGENII